jgi:3-oxoacyl-[acyl-carrier protein] reductase
MKTILITGASRGLGRSIALKFEEEKWNVISISSKNCDISNRKSVKDFFKGIERLDVVINNAGVNKNQLLCKTSIEDWNEILETNLTGVFNVCREAVRCMRKYGGHIINISSILGMKGKEGQCHYSASKAGLIGLTKSLARETAGWNIKVNAILPGCMETDMMTKCHMEMAKNENILGKTNKTEDVAKFIYQLTQTDFISGQVFNIDSRIIKL